MRRSLPPGTPDEVSMAGGGYEAGRDQAHLDTLGPAINCFVKDFQADTSANPQTVFLFPGGMGSQLERATQPANDGPPFSYYLLWLTMRIFGGESLDLEIDDTGADHNQQYVLPDGYIDLACLRPYDRFCTWCQSKGIHLFVFGFDWRRPNRETASFFLQTFLPNFETQFGGKNPLDNFSLIGHSSGGMVVKSILDNGTNAYVQSIQKAITVGTPFYGYGGQIHRFLVGDYELNWTLYLDLIFDVKKRMAELIATMPGGYEFLYLDADTFQANMAAFQSDPKYPLLSYPSIDAIDPTQWADPYHPTPAGAAVRYPFFDNHNMTLLGNGLQALQDVSTPLDPAIANKFYNIRGVQTQAGKDVNGTAVSQVWARVQNFDPDGGDADPITDTLGPGDGVQPAWGARLLQLLQAPYTTTNPPHVITIRNSDIDHVTMMNATSVLQKLGTLLGVGSSVKAMAKWKQAPQASRLELNKFIDGLSRSLRASEPSVEARRDALDRYLAKYKPADLHKLLRRGYSDLLKSPSLKVAPRPKPKSARSKKKTPSSGRSRSR
jgi:Lecithin:cholesterol acyltransferase